MGNERQNRLVGPVIAVRTFKKEDYTPDNEKQRRHLKWVVD